MSRVFKFAGAVMIVTLTFLVRGSTACGETEVDVPFLITLQPDSIQQAWDEVAALVRENEALGQPLPEPYFARGDIWTVTGNHEEAVDDYLRGTKLLFAVQPSLAEQSRTLDRLREALERLSKRPLPNFPVEAKRAFSAGVKHLECGRAKLAVAHLTEATRLRPLDPVYRTFRGLAHKRLGDITEAERQLAAAASIMRDPYHYIGDAQREFHIRLERVQGADRRWITDLISAPRTEVIPEITDASKWLQLHRIHGR